MAAQLFIPQIATSIQPVIPRERLLHHIINRVNENTLAVRVPRWLQQNSTDEAVQARNSSEVGTVTEGEIPGAQEDDVVEPVEDALGRTVTRYELRKQVSDVKVEDPDDPETFVTVARRVRSFYLLSDGTTMIDEYLITDG